MIPIYLAPMESITGHIFRNTINEMFGGIDRFYTPFIVPIEKRDFKRRELNDILPENNKGIEIVPQILTNDSEAFIKTADNLLEYGYNEINLNLGCPSGTVSSKFRGAGFLAKTKELDEFLYKVYEYYENKHVKVSVKTRIGIESESEFDEILDIYNKYPISELTIHPRLLKDYYKNEVHMNVFEDAYNRAKMPICYNGDVCNVEDYGRIASKYEKVSGIMIGRGLLANPILAKNIKENRNDLCDISKIVEFTLNLADKYESEFNSGVNALFKMKELWSYLYKNYGDEKLWKKIKKSKKLDEYKDIVKNTF